MTVTLWTAPMPLTVYTVLARLPMSPRDPWLSVHMSIRVPLTFTRCNELSQTYTNHFEQHGPGNVSPPIIWPGAFFFPEPLKGSRHLLPLMNARVIGNDPVQNHFRNSALDFP